MGYQESRADSGAGLPGGMPIRSFGTFSCKVADYDVFIERIAGIRQQYTMDEVKERITSMLDQLLMKWIAKEGRDMFNLQVNASEIGKGIQEDLDMEMLKIGSASQALLFPALIIPRKYRRWQKRQRPRV